MIYDNLKEAYKYAARAEKEIAKKRDLSFNEATYITDKISDLIFELLTEDIKAKIADVEIIDEKISSDVNLDYENIDFDVKCEVKKNYTQEQLEKLLGEEISVILDDDAYDEEEDKTMFTAYVGLQIRR